MRTPKNREGSAESVCVWGSLAASNISLVTSTKTKALLSYIYYLYINISIYRYNIFRSGKRRESGANKALETPKERISSTKAECLFICTIGVLKLRIIPCSQASFISLKFEVFTPFPFFPFPFHFFSYISPSPICKPGFLLRVYLFWSRGDGKKIKRRAASRRLCASMAMPQVFNSPWYDGSKEKINKKEFVWPTYVHHWGEKGMIVLVFATARVLSLVARAIVVVVMAVNSITGARKSSFLLDSCLSSSFISPDFFLTSEAGQYITYRDFFYKND